MSEVKRALADIAAERQRQIEVEGWIPAHDDGHADGSLADAAACYAAGRIPIARRRDAATIRFSSGRHVSLWPWDSMWWKPKDRRSNLVRAGALIVAEIERLDRLSAPGTVVACAICGRNDKQACQPGDEADV